MSRLLKTNEAGIARIRKSIASGDFDCYAISLDAKAKAIQRYSKLGDFPTAIDLLNDVAHAIFKAGKGSSGGDVANELMATYKVAKLEPDATSKGRVLALLRAFPSGEPSRKTFIGEIISWSGQFGKFPAGDPELHHAAGSLYAQERLVGPAEHHLVLGTKDSPDVLVRLQYAWYRKNDSHTAPFFCARSVLPYLLMRNLRSANAAYDRFVALLTTDNPNLGTQEVRGSVNACKLRVFPSLPLLNFLGFMLLAVQRGTLSPEETDQIKRGDERLWRELIMQYKQDLEGLGWESTLETIARMYFQIEPPRKFDMMGTLLSQMMGGGSRR
ncbi:hypothetical protein MKZ38_008345 [Zalerion maritima]|uniref:DUF410-domain-containing protein n=1 Tax=Zalerion maritima TaxID=339359 RepID=A0AAD5RW74_9PEZI|nr:hypothetical protein MKZ38_008345 [Zalerion maritima]